MLHRYYGLATAAVVLIWSPVFLEPKMKGKFYDRDRKKTKRLSWIKYSYLNILYCYLHIQARLKIGNKKFHILGAKIQEGQKQGDRTGTRCKIVAYFELLTGLLCCLSVFPCSITIFLFPDNNLEHKRA